MRRNQVLRVLTVDGCRNRHGTGRPRVDMTEGKTQGLNTVGAVEQKARMRNLPGISDREGDIREIVFIMKDVVVRWPARTQQTAVRLNEAKAGNRQQCT